MNDLPSLASELVAIETENPPGNERPCAEFVVDWFDDHGIEAELVEEPSAARPNAVATVGEDDPAGEGGPTLVLNGHTDVVPAGDPDRWTHDPYGGVVEDGRLYGRGSADMKTGLALAMLTARDLADEIEADLDGSLVVHAAMGEETGEPGTRTLLDAGYSGDYAVVLEPTGLRTATAAKGVATYRLGVGGESAHASHPDQGTSAIEALRALMDIIEAYDAEVRDRTNPLCGQAYATVTEIEAGTDSNMAVLPERAEILLDRRTLPGEEIETVHEEIDELLAEVEHAADVETDRELVEYYAPSSIPADHHLAERFRQLSGELADAPRDPWGLEAATDAREFTADGIPAIIWGPGSLSQAHTTDEHVDLAEAERGLEILKRASRELLSETDQT